MKLAQKIGFVMALVSCAGQTFAVTLPQHPAINEQGEFLETSELPSPHVTPHVTKHLSLKEAILLALRNNPDVISDELTRVTDKFSLEEAYNLFEPQYSLTASNTMDRGEKPAYSINPEVSLTTPLGTTLTTDYENTLTGGRGNYEFSVTQPLLKNFGTEYNLASLRDAIDTEKVAKWSFKNNIITAVGNVISQYRSLVEDYNNLRVQEENLKESEETVKQYKLEAKVGKIAKSDLLQQESAVASDRVDLLSTKNELATAYQDFLETLGLSSDSKVEIDKNITFKEYKLPTLKEAIQIALENNPTYQSSLLNLEVTKRGVITAENDNRWKLDLTASETTNQTGGASGSTSDDSSVALSLEIPIDDMSAKEELVSAKISLEQAKLALEESKQELIRTVTSQYATLKIDYKSVGLSRTSVALAKRTVADEKIKLKYGKTTVFEVNQLNDNLLEYQINLISTEISYLNDITTFEATLGTTLDHWDIKLRY